MKNLHKNNQLKFPSREGWLRSRRGGFCERDSIGLINIRAFSLIEITLSIAIFSIMMTVVFTMFQSMLQAQMSLNAGTNIDENLKFIMEVMSKEIRDAKSNHNFCNLDATTDNVVYNTNFDSSQLSFVNKNGECVIYRVGGTNQLEISRAGTALLVTPASISITELKFNINDDHSLGATTVRNTQAGVTISFKAEAAEGKYKKTTRVQTSVFSRYYGN